MTDITKDQLLEIKRFEHLMELEKKGNPKFFQILDINLPEHLLPKLDGIHEYLKHKTKSIYMLLCIVDTTSIDNNVNFYVNKIIEQKIYKGEAIGIRCTVFMDTTQSLLRRLAVNSAIDKMKQIFKDKFDLYPDIQVYKGRILVSFSDESITRLKAKIDSKFERV